MTIHNVSNMTFTVLGIGDTLPSDAGLYIFAREVPPVDYDLLYIGQAINFSERISSSHEKWNRALRCGMTHILIHRVNDPEDRSLLEGDLIATHRPSLNVRNQ